MGSEEEALVGSGQWVLCNYPPNFASSLILNFAILTGYDLGI